MAIYRNMEGNEGAFDINLTFMKGQLLTAVRPAAGGPAAILTA